MAAKAKSTSASGAEAKRLEQAEMLLDISRKMAAIETLDEVLEALIKMTTWEMGAERSTLFLNDPQTGELYSRFAQGNFQREIRLLNTSGIAGHVFQSGKGQIIHNPYKDKRFNRAIDEQTGFKTRSILCAPIKTAKGEVIGVAQTLNKKKGRFTKGDMELLEAMTMQATISLQSTQFVERMKKTREKEMEFLDVVSDVTSEINLGAMLQKVMREATRMLNADRSTLFLNDEKTNELFSRVAQGNSIGEIRLPNHLGIAGHVFTSGKHGQYPLCLRRFALQSGLRQENRLLHPLHTLRSHRQQERQDHRRHPGIEQAWRPFHRRRRTTAQGLHRPGRYRTGKRQALRRRPEHEKL